MPLPKKIDTAKTLKMHLQGASLSEIAKVQDVSKQTVHRDLKNILARLADKETVGFYQQNQAQIFDGLAVKIACGISDEDIENATLQQKATSIGILTDKSRLISGQSTANLSVVVAKSAGNAWANILGDSIPDEAEVTDITSE